MVRITALLLGLIAAAGADALPGGSPAVVSGRVLTPEGKPVQGARLLLHGGRSASSLIESQRDGGYRIAGVEPGKRTIRIQHQDFATGWQEVRVPPEGTRLDIVLQPRPRPIVRGRVIGPDGEPIAGAVVSSVLDKRTTTLADGTFELELDQEEVEALEEGTWLEARKAGYAGGTAEGLKPPVEGVEIRLIPGITLTGRLLGLEPEEMARAKVEDSRRLRESGVDAGGRYKLADLPPSTLSVKATASGRSVEEEVTLPAGAREITLDLTFPPTSEVRGRVLSPDGQPVADAAVAFDPPIGIIAGRRVRTEPDGSYSIRLEDGTYTAYVWAEDYLDSQEERSVTVSGRPVDGFDFRLERGAVLTGRLLGLLPGETPAAVFAEGGRSGTADQEGNYRITGLPAGEWNILAVLEGRFRGPERIGRGRVTIPPGTNAASLDLDFALGDLTLSGRVITPRGENPEVWARLLLPDGQEAVVNRFKLEEGVFRFDRLRAGTYRLRISGAKNQVLADELVELGADLEVVVEVR